MNEYQLNWWFIFIWFWDLFDDSLVPSLKIARFEAVSSTVYCSCSKSGSIPTKWIENYQMVYKWIKTQLNPIYTYLYKKRGIIQRIQYKRIDKCHKSIVKITKFLHLSNSPQLELVCPQTRNKQLKEQTQKSKNHESTSFEKRKQMYGSNEKRYTQRNILTTNYNDNINTKQMLNTNNIPNILKQH